MVNALQRPTIQRGARIAVVSPASAAQAARVEAGCAHLSRYGYEPVLMPHALARGPLYFAGNAETRAGDLHAALTDPQYDAVFCTRGGWGSAELLPFLEQLGTAAHLRGHPRAFVGYSDHTSLHTWLQQRCGIMSFYGPMVAADWYLDDGVDLPSWEAALEGSQIRFGAKDGLRTLRPGFAKGAIAGGCLAIVEAGLGTPWALEIDRPTVLFLEDIGVKPYQWDRMLHHLGASGLLKQVTGLVLGDMSANVEQEDMPLLEAACLHALRDFDGPVAIGLRCGHVCGGNRTVPMAAEAELHCEERGVEFRIAGNVSSSPLGSAGAWPAQGEPGK